MHEVPSDLFHRLRTHRQEHTLLNWENLTHTQRRQLVEQLARIDFEEIAKLHQRRDEVATLPDPKLIQPAVMESSKVASSTLRLGEEALARGEVAVLLVAGGQGSRLGFEKPKGMFPIGPVSNKTLFQIHADKVFALMRRHGKPVPYLVMTSPATDADTREYFHEHHYFGLPRSEVFFFQQGTLPAVDLATGRLLLEQPGVLFTSPNGHGGTLTALAETGLLADLRKRGIRSIFYFQVDNPLVKMADAAFLGRHLELKSEASSKAIEKAYPEEKMGVFATIEGRCGIIEYSDMPKSLIGMVDDQGKLLHRAGSPAIHIFDVDFLTRVTQRTSPLPFHLAKKKVPCIDENGNPVTPQKENALKFEMFIFDALPMAERWLVMESPRSEEFSPVKNAEGVDSPKTAKHAIIELAAKWHELAGVAVPRDAEGKSAVPLEISPRFALDHEEFKERVPADHEVKEAKYWE
jgi:UDP-N-acetylglucosamine/UDP-N-acetylgalactosamine diphosphorylase